MSGLVHTLGHLLELAGIFLVLVFVAWALVTLGVLADSSYLLHAEKANVHLRKPGRPAPRLVEKRKLEKADAA